MFLPLSYPYFHPSNSESISRIQLLERYLHYRSHYCCFDGNPRGVESKLTSTRSNQLLETKMTRTSLDTNPLPGGTFPSPHVKTKPGNGPQSKRGPNPPRTFYIHPLATVKNRYLKPARPIRAHKRSPKIQNAEQQMRRWSFTDHQPPNTTTRRKSQPDPTVSAQKG
jgi:hypothetical protein